MKKLTTESKKLLVTVEKLRDVTPEQLVKVAGGRCTNYSKDTAP